MVKLFNLKHQRLEAALMTTLRQMTLCCGNNTVTDLAQNKTLHKLAGHIPCTRLRGKLTCRKTHTSCTNATDLGHTHGAESRQVIICHNFKQTINVMHIMIVQYISTTSQTLNKEMIATSNVRSS